MDLEKKIVLANYHAAYKMKCDIKKYLLELGFKNVKDVGTDSEEKVDYPIYAVKACNNIVTKKADLGILFCGTGIGMSIAANKINGIRACAANEILSATLSKMHNNSNVLCIGARIVGIEVAKKIVYEWLKTEYIGGYHENRIEMLNKIEKEDFHFIN